MAHSAYSSMLHSSLGLTLLPTRLITLRSQLVTVAGSELTSVSSGCTHGLNTVCFHPSVFEVSFDAVSRRSLLPLVHQVITCAVNHHSAYLLGIARCTSLGVGGRCRIRTCGVRSSSREMLPSSTRPTFQKYYPEY